MKHKPSGGDAVIEETKMLAEALGHVTVVRKGRQDIITDGKEGKYRIHWLQGLEFFTFIPNLTLLQQCGIV